MLHIMRRNRLFFRMLLYFSTMLIPVILISIVLYWSSTNVAKRDFSHSINLNMKSSVDTIDIYIRTIQESNMNFFERESLIPLFVPHNKMSAKEKSELYKIPQMIGKSQKIVSELIDSVFVYWDDQKVYTIEGAEDYDFFFRFRKFANYEPSFWTRLLQLEQKQNLIVLPPTDVISARKKTSVIPIVQISDISGARVIMVTNISVQAVLKTLHSNSIIQSTDFIVMNNDHRFMLASNRIGSDAAAAFSELQPIVAQEYEEISLQGEQTVLTSIRSSYFGWMYYSATPSREFARHSKEILTMTVLTCLSLSVFGFILSIIFSFKIYNPIRTIRNILQENSETSEGYNDWELINNSITHLLDDNWNQRGHAEKIANVYMDNMLINLIKGHPVEREDLLSEALVKSIGVNGDYYLCCNFLFDFQPAFYTEFQDTDRLMIMDKLRIIIATCFKSYYPVYVIQLPNQLYSCVVNLANPMESKYLDSIVETVIQSFSYDSIYSHLYIGIGNIYEGKESLWKSFNEAMTAIEHADRKMSYEVIHAKDIPIKPLLHFTHHHATVIENNLRMGNKEGIERILEELLQENKRQKVSYAEMNKLFIELYRIGIRFAAEHGLDINDYLIKERDFLHEGMASAQKLAALIDFYETIMDNIVDQSPNKTESLVSAISNYIDSNFRNDIYLEKISSDLGFSANYISRLFKQKTGMNLSDYVNFLRIEEAKKMLKETSLPMDEISKQVGIFSRTTFIRLFKKSEGIPPSKYKELVARSVE